MSDLFKNKYRIPSARLQTYNYARQGMYFVTICTKFMQHYFGKIITDRQTKTAKLEPTQIGKIAESEWYKSLEMRPDMNLDIGEFIVMPNHIHGIIIIGKNEFNSSGNIGELNGNSESQCGSSTDAMHRVSTQSASATQSAYATQSTPQNAFAPQSKNLASIIRGYKSAVTTYARKNNIRFEWHVRYHDHIIRNEEEYLRISNYIKNNPSKWLDDKFNNTK
jgi:putative transposase